ncbi:hypothetical protein CLAFUW4_10627 [Fulvia fulva]|uniref:Uncharacterized protein n=1 Tax=Passalora fulva TaxID=5499 RepID=A0A9Q8LF57_PASFU|nr:uncharacterized protein CLAFUR5_05240 [Fulvia fulva]KAK4615539.1 hypothetical protein CLAFUR4_10632 [Fulvia fulva]KAK4616838.1 hypothetical protein CLAFUR0_10612 [Fulvia fulva]UJO16270.1 hypothetical protein CLAFUR5_05240 [Fulvia fulva]WPV19422.1 hypothetical protein CLAFUW4_10627 [Fulvia fulva]WPV33990.1 hypothetical protein CLAFUW7_10629 [Fulvia fulva]
MAGSTPERVIWIGDDALLPKATDTATLDEQSALIFIYDSDLKNQAEYLPSCYQRKEALRIQKATNGSWVSFDAEQKLKGIHQSIVVASQLQVMPTFTTWKEFAGSLSAKPPTKASGPAGMSKRPQRAKGKKPTKKELELKKKTLLTFC